MLAQKQSLIFCLFKTGGGGGGRRNQNCLQNPENELFFWGIWGKTRAHFWGFKDKGWVGGGTLKIVLRRQNMSACYFASIPYTIYTVSSGGGAIYLRSTRIYTISMGGEGDLSEISQNLHNLHNFKEGWSDLSENSQNLHNLYNLHNFNGWWSDLSEISQNLHNLHNFNGWWSDLSEINQNLHNLHNFKGGGWIYLGSLLWF